MARKFYPPEEFIRDHLGRGFNTDQILSLARKKDKGFYKIVEDTLSHKTLIEKISNQVEDFNQGQLNFDSGSYSSKNVQEKIQNSNHVTKKRDNGRSNLPIHTDIEYDDLEAPLPNIYKNKKKKQKINELRKKNLANQMSLFDEIQEKVEQSKPQPTIKVEKLATTNEEQTACFTIKNEDYDNIETIKKNTEDQTYLPSVIDPNEIMILQKELNKKTILLNELNKNIGIKEAKIHSIRAISEDAKSKFFKELKALKRKYLIYKAGFVSIASISIVALCLANYLKVKISYSNDEQQSLLPKTELAQDRSTHQNSLRDISTTAAIDFIEFIDQEGVARNPEAIDQMTDNTEPNLASNSVVDSEASSPVTLKKPTIKHVVKSGDSWWKITRKYWGKEKAHEYKKIIRYNSSSENGLLKGQEIIIPDLAELENLKE